MYLRFIHVHRYMYTPLAIEYHSQKQYTYCYMYIQCIGIEISNKYYTSSLSRIRTRSGRDMDHWLRQFSNIMIFMIEDNICWRISGCSSRILRGRMEGGSQSEHKHLYRVDIPST